MTQDNKPLTINQSRIKVWETCHRQHYYKYELELPQDNTSRALQFGTSFHWLVEQGEDHPGVIPEKLPRIVEREIDPLIYDEAIAVFKEYEFFYRRNRLKYKPIGEKRTEILLELLTKTGIKLKGTADAIAEYEGGLWLVDHKTFGKAIPEMHDLIFSRQASFYYYLFDKVLGIHLDGIIWDYVKSKPIKPPRHSGYSFYKPSQQVLPVAAGDFMLQNRMSLAMHSDYLQATQKNAERYFHRIPIRRDEHVQNQMLESIQKSIQDIKTIGSTAKEPTVSMKCNWCSFRERCLAENRKNKNPKE